MADNPSCVTVAVVDDDPRLLRSLESLLESAGYAVRLFASAAALLDSNGLKEADCLISDVNMPSMDGLELARLARAARPDLPIILITGHPEMLDRPGSAGTRIFERLFTKPYNTDELLAAISETLGNSRPPT